MTPTDRALHILRQHPEGLMPREFARLMWPDSPAWDKLYRVGRGSTRGVGMQLAGGSLLATLSRKGLVMLKRTDNHWYYVLAPNDY